MPITIQVQPLLSPRTLLLPPNALLLCCATLPAAAHTSRALYRCCAAAACWCRIWKGPKQLLLHLCCGQCLAALQLLLDFLLFFEDVANVTSPGAPGSAVVLAYTHCCFIPLSELQQ